MLGVALDIFRRGALEVEVNAGGKRRESMQDNQSREMIGGTAKLWMEKKLQVDKVTGRHIYAIPLSNSRPVHHSGETPKVIAS